jgi:predicted GH43/DUF377 family glycosyl hydrolase
VTSEMKFVESRLLFSPNNFASNSPWMQRFTQAPNGIVLEDRIRIYFCTRKHPTKAGQYVSRVGFVDFSLNEPFKLLRVSDRPVLELGQAGEFDEHGTYPFSPIKVGNEIYAAYGGWTRPSTVPFDVALGLSRSTYPFEKFQKFNTGPILGKSQQEPFVLSSPKLRFFDGIYYLFYIAGEKWHRFGNDSLDVHYRIRLAYSKDLVSWERLERDLITPKGDYVESQASPDVFFHNNSYYMLFSYRPLGGFTLPARGYKLGLAKSKNLLTWDRIDNELSIETNLGDWESESRNYPHILELPNGNIYMFYTGNGIGATGFGTMRLEF